MQIEPSVIQKCIENDRLAQKELYKTCYSYMMAVCYRYAQSEDEAVEYMNMGFFKVLKGLEKKPSDIPFKYWLRKILINSMIDEFRKTKKYKESIVLSDYATNGSEGLNYALNQAESNLEVEDLYALIRQLPAMSQKVFNLYVVDGYNHREIANMMDISEGTSKWHISTAKAKLKEMILKKDRKLKVV